MWSEHFLWKHHNNQDVAFEVLKKFYVKEKDVWKLKVRWWRISRKRPPEDMRIEQRIVVPESKRKEWGRI